MNVNRLDLLVDFRISFDYLQKWLRGVHLGVDGLEVEVAEGNNYPISDVVVMRRLSFFVLVRHHEVHEADSSLYGSKPLVS